MLEQQVILEENERQSSSDSSIEIISVEPTAPFIFSPVNEEWQKIQCERLNLTFQVKSYPEQSTEAPGLPRDSPPTRTQKIKGDGNCAYRSFSFVLTGSENSYQEVREQLVKFMSSHRDKVLWESGTNIDSYLNNTRRDGVWATEIELLAFSEMTNVAVHVYSNKVWMGYRVHSAANTVNNIYIDHVNGNHYNVVLQV